jgi:hypothetical protein
MRCNCPTGLNAFASIFGGCSTKVRFGNSKNVPIVATASKHETAPWRHNAAALQLRASTSRVPHFRGRTMAELSRRTLIKATGLF